MLFWVCSLARNIPVNKSCCAQEVYALVMEDGFIVWYQVMVDALKKRKAEMEWSERVYSIRRDSQGKPLWESKFKQRPELTEWVKNIWWKWKSLGRVQLFVTPWTIGHGILLAKILEWVAFPFSKGSSQPRDRTQVYPHCRWILYQLSHKGSSRYCSG